MYETNHRLHSEGSHLVKLGEGRCTQPYHCAKACPLTNECKIDVHNLTIVPRLYLCILLKKDTNDKRKKQRKNSFNMC